MLPAWVLIIFAIRTFDVVLLVLLVASYVLLFDYLHVCVTFDSNWLIILGLHVFKLGTLFVVLFEVFIRCKGVSNFFCYDFKLVVVILRLVYLFRFVILVVRKEDLVFIVAIIWQLSFKIVTPVLVLENFDRRSKINLTLEKLLARYFIQLRGTTPVCLIIRLVVIGALELLCILVTICPITVITWIVLIVFTFHLFLLIEIRNVTPILIGSILVHLLSNKLGKYFFILHSWLGEQLRILNLRHIQVNLVLKTVFV